MKRKIPFQQVDVVNGSDQIQSFTGDILRTPLDSGHRSTLVKKKAHENSHKANKNKILPNHILN